MAVIKIFDSRGIKTLVLAGNCNEQEYDDVEDTEDISASEDTEAEE